MKKMTQVCFTLDPELLAFLEKLQKDEGRTRSGFLAYILLKYAISKGYNVNTKDPD